MTGDTDEQTYRAEVVVRSLAPYGVNERQREIIERVEGFRDRGVIADVEVDVWGRGIRTDAEERTTAHERYDALESWADGNEYSLSPGFVHHQRGSLVEDESEAITSFPLICLVVYAVGGTPDGDAVRAVFPCSDDERTYTVADGIEALEHRTTPGSTESPADDGTDPDASADLPEQGYPSVIERL